MDNRGQMVSFERVAKTESQLGDDSVHRKIENSRTVEVAIYEYIVKRRSPLVMIFEDNTWEEYLYSAP